MRKLSFLSILFIFSIVSLSLGQFAFLFRSGGGAFYLFDACIGIFALYGLLYFLGVKKKLNIPRIFIPFLLFTVLAIISLLLRLTTLSSDEMLFSSFYLIRWIIYLLAAIILFNAVKSRKISQDLVFNSFFVAALTLSLIGFIQLIVLPDFTVLDPSLGWDPHKNRLASTFFDPNFMGGFLAFTIGLALSLHFYKIKTLSRPRLIFYVLIPLVALFLTFSRSSWGMLAIIVFTLGLLKARWLLILSLFLMFATYFAVPRVQTRITGVTDPADSAAFRVVSWKKTLEIAQDNLLIGVGFNSFRYAQRDAGIFEAGTLGGNSGAGSDSSFLLVLVTTGIFGFLLFLTGYFWGMREAALRPILLGLFLHSQFVNSLFYPQMLFAWLVVLGLFSFPLSISRK